MKLDVIFSATQAESHDMANSLAVVIDILRATTTMCAAFDAGASRVYTASTIEDARRLKSNHPDTFLCGERKGFRIEGFDYGNSPVEISGAPVSGREIILTTTNGTIAVAASRRADRIVAASLRNLTAVAGYIEDYVRENGTSNVVLVCSGTGGRFSLDDVYAAGRLVSMLEHPADEVSDAACAAMLLSRGRVDEVVTKDTCRHVKLLIDIGFAGDIDYAFELDSSSCVPVFDDDSFHALRDRPVRVNTA